MERLTTDRDYLVDKEQYERHLAQGYSRSKPQARYLRLCEYERTEHTPEKIAEFDQIYLEKCQEVNRLNAELAELKKLPQGDLISRKAVMGLIESKCTDGCLGTEDTTLIDAHGLIDDVSDISATYDVEKVVEQLEELRDFKADRFNISKCGLIQMVIDVVRAGGKE